MASPILKTHHSSFLCPALSVEVLSCVDYFQRIVFPTDFRYSFSANSQRAVSADCQFPKHTTWISLSSAHFKTSCFNLLSNLAFSMLCESFWFSTKAIWHNYRCYLHLSRLGNKVRTSVSACVVWIGGNSAVSLLALLSLPFKLWTAYFAVT